MHKLHCMKICCDEPFNETQKQKFSVKFCHKNWFIRAYHKIKITRESHFLFAFFIVWHQKCLLIGPIKFRKIEMTLNIRILDLTNLNLSLEIPDKTTVSQLTKILSEKHNINTIKCTFAAMATNELDTLTKAFSVQLRNYHRRYLLYPPKSSYRWKLVSNQKQIRRYFPEPARVQRKERTVAWTREENKRILTRISIYFLKQRSRRHNKPFQRRTLWQCWKWRWIRRYGDSYDGDMKVTTTVVVMTTMMTRMKTSMISI